MSISSEKLRKVLHPIQIDTMHFRFKPRRNPGSQSQHRSVNRTAVILGVFLLGFLFASYQVWKDERSLSTDPRVELIDKAGPRDKGDGYFWWDRMYRIHNPCDFCSVYFQVANDVPLMKIDTDPRRLPAASSWQSSTENRYLRFDSARGDLFVHITAVRLTERCWL